MVESPPRHGVSWSAHQPGHTAWQLALFAWASWAPWQTDTAQQGQSPCVATAGLLAKLQAVDTAQDPLAESVMSRDLPGDTGACPLLRQSPCPHGGLLSLLSWCTKRAQTAHLPSADPHCGHVGAPPCLSGVILCPTLSPLSQGSHCFASLLILGGSTMLAGP